MKRVSIFLIMAALIAGMAGCGPVSQNLEIQTWYDLDDVRDNLEGHHTLMNDLDSSTAGYEELAGPTANGGKGWEPIYDPDAEADNPFFTGTFDGQGHEIRDLFISRPGEMYVGLFGVVDEACQIEDIGVTNCTVIGDDVVGGLVGLNEGSVSNSHSTGNLSGESGVGGLVGWNGDEGTVINSYSSGDVTGFVIGVGGLVGWNTGTVSNSYATGSVIGDLGGGLVGVNEGSVTNSYSTGNVTGRHDVGGLVGGNGYDSIVIDCYATGDVYGDRAVGGLAGTNVGSVSDSYSAGNVTGEADVGGLVGGNYDIVSNSYSTGSVTGNSSVGGLVGLIDEGNVSNSYSTGNVTGVTHVGGLVGWNEEGTVTNSFWDTQTSGQATSDGGTGKNTTEMQNIDTFSGAGWYIIAVGGPGERNHSYIWNIVNNVTYPFLGWQPV